MSFLSDEPDSGIISYIMRTYELMVVVKNDFAHEDEKKRTAFVEKLLTEQQYSKLTVDDFGKKELAYEIEKQKEGCYLLATIEAETMNIARLEQQVKLTENVLRYLLTKVK